MSEKSLSSVLYTIGHSNHNLETLIDLLQSHGIKAVADVRSMPGSRRLPYFNAEALSESLPAAGIEYHPWKGLGGRRKARPDSQNTGWNSVSFRGYADYMATQDFHDSLAQLLVLAQKQPLAVMCAEAVPWRCHRNLIADAAVLLHGWEVRHIMTAKSATVHKPMSFAKIEADHLVYPADDLLS